VEAALNQQPPTVTMIIDGKSMVDPQATLNAREKWQAIRDQFRSWVYSDDARRDRLLRLYNDMFNKVVPRRFDGSHLQLPGMSAVVVPYPHQKDGIWRIVVGGNTLLAHCVGAGKTLTMIAAGMELRRLGKARKPLHVVQGSTLEQYCAEALRLYPQSKVLMATKEDLSGDKRRTFVARVATGDWDAVVMTQSTFERLMLSPEVQRDFIDKMLDEARMSMTLTSDSGAKRSIKEIERRMKDYEAKLERLVENGKSDETAVWFDDLGIDHVMIDEAHAYKNMAKITKMPRIAGIPNTASQRAFDVFMKTRVIMGKRGGREEGVVMATATPLSNSLC
jgi:N12 class adenine-specific DNA methylase